MLEKLRKTFHTDKWWGKTIFIVLIYILYWCIFYGSTLLIPNSNSNTDINAVLPFLYIFIIVPIISFLVPFIILKTIKISKIFLYILHVLLIIFFAVSFFMIVVFFALHNFQIG